MLVGLWWQVAVAAAWGGQSFHVEGEELEVLAHRGGLGDVLLRVIGVLGHLHLASHRDQATSLWQRVT